MDLGEIFRNHSILVMFQIPGEILTYNSYNVSEDKNTLIHTQWDRMDKNVARLPGLNWPSVSYFCTDTSVTCGSVFMDLWFCII